MNLIDINIGTYKDNLIIKKVKLIAVRIPVFIEFTKKSYFSDIYMNLSVIHGLDNIIYIIGDDLELFFDVKDIHKSFVQFQNVNNFFIEKGLFLLPEIPPEILFRKNITYSGSSIYLCESMGNEKFQIKTIYNSRIFQFKDIVTFEITNSIDAVSAIYDTSLKFTISDTDYVHNTNKNINIPKRAGKLKTKVKSSEGTSVIESKTLKVKELQKKLPKEPSQTVFKPSDIKDGGIKEKNLSIEIEALIKNSAKIWWDLFIKYHNIGEKKEAIICVTNALWIDRSLHIKLKTMKEEENQIINDCPELNLLFIEELNEDRLLKKNLNLKLLWLLSIIRSSSRYDYFWAFEKREFVQNRLKEHGVRVGVEIPKFIKNLTSDELMSILSNNAENSKRIDRNDLTKILWEFIKEIEKKTDINKDVLFKKESFTDRIKRENTGKRFKTLFLLKNFYNAPSKPFYTDYQVIEEEEIILNKLILTSTSLKKRIIHLFSEKNKSFFSYPHNREISEYEISLLKIPYFIYKFYFSGLNEKGEFFDNFMSPRLNADKLNKILSTYVEIAVSNKSVNIDHYFIFLQFLIKNNNMDYYFKFIEIIIGQLGTGLITLAKHKKTEQRAFALVDKIKKKFKKIYYFEDFSVSISLIKFRLETTTTIDNLLPDIKKIGMILFPKKTASQTPLVDIRDIIMQWFTVLQFISYEEKVGIVYDIIQNLKDYDAGSQEYLKGQIYFNLIKYLESVELTPDTFINSYKRWEDWNIRRTMEKDLKKLRNNEFILNL